MKQASILISMMFIWFMPMKSQTTNDVLNVLIQRKLISQQEADSLRADAAIKQQETDAKKKSFPLNASKLLQLSGYTQIRYQHLEDTAKVDGFDVRRARLDLKGSISPIFGYRLQTEFAGTPRLLDAYAEVKLADYFNLTIGQQKICFSLENQAADDKYDFIDRSQVVEALSFRSTDIANKPLKINNNGRDIGLVASGKLFKVNSQFIVDYYVGIYNGAGINVADSTNSKDISTRLVLHPIEGLGIGGSYYDGVGRFGKPWKSQGRSRIGLELSYAFKSFSLQGEYIHAKDGSVKKDGYYLQAGYYVLPQKLEIIGRYDSYDNDKSKSGDASYWYVAGMNYTFNSNTRIQFAYTVKQEQGPYTSNNLLVTQFLISF